MRGKILLAADFDGTLAPIRQNPGVVLPDPELIHFLCEASELDDVAVAIISGRDLEDLSHRVGAIPAYLAGSHGLEIRDPGGVMLREVAPLATDIDPELEQSLIDAGARLERKKHGIALHWRGSPGFDEHHHLALRFREWGTSSGLELIDGRLVIEARLPGGGKERALAFIGESAGADRIVYAGDDLTDFAALSFAATRGLAVFMRSEEREAAPGWVVVASRAELLDVFESELSGHVRQRAVSG